MWPYFCTTLASTAWCSQSASACMGHLACMWKAYYCQAQGGVTFTEQHCWCTEGPPAPTCWRTTACCISRLLATAGQAPCARPTPARARPPSPRPRTCASVRAGSGRSTEVRLKNMWGGWKTRPRLSHTSPPSPSTNACGMVATYCRGQEAKQVLNGEFSFGARPLARDCAWAHDQAASCHSTQCSARIE